MTGSKALVPKRRNVELIDLHPAQKSLREEVVAGLSRSPRELPAKYFYDERGSELFEEITRLPEYYLTRTEISILERFASEIIEEFGADYELVELGSGSSSKVRILLDAGALPAVYMPIDISRDQLLTSAESLGESYPELRIVALCADYTAPLELPPARSRGARIIFFPGSTIGNLHPGETVEFFQHTARLLRPGDGILLGADLRKSGAVLHAAYNDAAGVTAEFNKNVILRINKELGGDFDLSAFEHEAFYEADLGRIEMHLRSIREQVVTIPASEAAGDGSRYEPAQKFHFSRGGTIHTESSYKYLLDTLDEPASAAGFRPARCWVDDEKLFSVQLFRLG